MVLGDDIGRSNAESSRVNEEVSVGEASDITILDLHTDDAIIWNCRIKETKTNIGATELIWGHPTNGIFGTGSWATGYSGSVDVTAVYNSHNIFPEGFWNERFNDSSNTTATWTNGSGTGSCAFDGATLEEMYTSSIFLGASTDKVNKVTLTVIGSDATLLDWFASTNGGSDWEKVTPNSQHNFAVQSNDLRIKASNDASLIGWPTPFASWGATTISAEVTYFEVKYNLL